MAKRYRVNVWYQVAGDTNPATYGGTIARESPDGQIALIKIQPVVEYVGEADACRIGFPFWTREGCYDRADLDRCLASYGTDASERGWHPIGYVGAEPTDFDLRTRADRFRLACAMLDYGDGAEEGPAGWSRDIMGTRRVSWWSKGGFGGRQADAEFRRMMKERA